MMFFKLLPAAILFSLGIGRASALEIREVKHGIVCFTFDDGRYRTWLPQMELFRRYHAHATFFYGGILTPEAADSMRILRENGHSIGLHTVHHRDCPENGFEAYFDAEIKPQIESAGECGIRDLRHFAYPNNRHTEEADRFLGKYFVRFRAGIGVKAPKGYWIADQDAAYTPLAEIAGKKALGGCGIGPYYRVTRENLEAALTRAAWENKLIVFFSHGILPDARGVDMSPELLEQLLRKASELQMRIVGFDELPEAAPGK